MTRADYDDVAAALLRKYASQMNDSATLTTDAIITANEISTFVKMHWREEWYR
jgi:hypothetical protein